jgi:hypothetical protein
LNSIRIQICKSRQHRALQIRPKTDVIRYPEATALSNQCSIPAPRQVDSNSYRQTSTARVRRRSY